jgi:twitching motility protein PilT
MTLETLINSAREIGASDLHLEPGLPAARRVRGELRVSGDPLPGRLLMQFARELAGEEGWQQFLVRRSHDLSKVIGGVRCRINLLQTGRGVGFAIRLLAGFQATIESLNLHPDLKGLGSHSHGLVIVTGATGSGKSSTLAALIQEINLAASRHILTIESPVEYVFTPKRSFIRQREVGRDTPSFEQALLDALREDPDVLMVGEMRDPETMRLTLNAAETGHLVLVTMHSSNAAEAVARIVGAFPSEIQGAVAGQLADSLVAVVAQRLKFRPDLGLRIPECEVLTATVASRAMIRNRDFFKLASVMETGAESGMWTFARYQTWLERRTQWFKPADLPPPPAEELARTEFPPTTTAHSTPSLRPAGVPSSPVAEGQSPKPTGPHRIEIDAVEGESEILRPNRPV